MKDFCITVSIIMTCVLGFEFMAAGWWCFFLKDKKRGWKYTLVGFILALFAYCAILINEGG